MYDVAGEKSPIFVESDAFLYNLGDPNYSILCLESRPIIQKSDGLHTTPPTLPKGYYSHATLSCIFSSRS
jgi:hypothetical protein